MINGLLAVYLTLLLVVGLVILSRLYGLNLFGQLLVKENPAVAVSFAGFAFGLAFALTGLFFGHMSPDWIPSLYSWGLEGLLALCLVILTVGITDRLLLPRFPIAKEIADDQNTGVACVIAGVCVSAGLVINGSLCGYSASIPAAIRDIVMYWGLAQIAIWITLRVIILVRPFDFVRQLEEDDNLASGLSLGFFVISLGLLGRAAVIHSGQMSVWTDFGSSCFRWLLGLVVLLGLLSLLKLLLRRRGVSLIDLELANCHAPVVMWGAIQITLAMIISLLLQRPK